MEHDEPHAAVLPVDPDLEAEARPRHGRGFRRATLAAVAAGGALGAPARYEMTRLIHVAKDGFPWAIFWTNVSGSLVLGFFLILIIERFPPSRYARPFFATGFLGAYTTFSTYMIDTDTLFKDGQVLTGIAYLVGSAVAALLAVWIGITMARSLPIRRSVAT